MENGALGCGISGSGPSVLALSQGIETAQKVAAAMRNIFEDTDIAFEIHVSGINSEGVKII
jgi:homoserine kinase